MKQLVQTIIKKTPQILLANCVVQQNAIQNTKHRNASAVKMKKCRRRKTMKCMHTQPEIHIFYSKPANTFNPLRPEIKNFWNRTNRVRIITTLSKSSVKSSKSFSNLTAQN